MNADAFSDTMEVLILTLLFFTVTCEENVNNTGALDQTPNITKCDDTVTDTHRQVITDIDAVCGPSTPCFAKCCEIDELFYAELIDGKRVQQCLHIDIIQKKMKENLTDFDFDSILDYSDYKIYDKDIRVHSKRVAMNKSLKKFNIVVNKQLVHKSCGMVLSEEEYSMLEDGRFVMLVPNAYNWIQPKNLTEYCIEKFVNPKVLKIYPRGFYVHFFKFIRNSEENSKSNSQTIFRAVAMIISALFLLLVLLVYSLLKQLRNIQGMVLMAYVTTLAIGYLIKAALLLAVINETINNDRCEKWTPVCYIFLLSSFFWLNIMSFDIWWTFRGFRKVRAIHRQGELVKFMWYGLYAWGVPALLGVIAYCLDAVIDLKDHPEIVTPHFKFCFEGEETILYLHTPILIMTVFNTLLSFMTIYNIWLINNGIANFNNSKKSTNENNRNRFCLYIKISTLMGVTWIIELLNLISSDSYNDWLFILSNMFNLFIGVAIFIMYVIKKSIFKKLCDRFNIETKFNKRKVNITKSLEYSRSGKSDTNTKNDNFDTIDESKIVVDLKSKS